VSEVPDYWVPPGETIPGVADDNEAFREQIRGYLRRRLANGNRYVKSWQVAEEFDVTSQRVGANMRILREAGDLSVFSESRHTVYRIELDEGDGDA
jgi:hypothetical protein